MPHRHESSVEHVEKLANLMDSQFTLPGTSINIGLDTIIGFVPGIGDTIGLAISGYIVSHAARIGVSKRTLGRMGFNIGIDWLIGLIPLIGDLFDWGWKANNRNARLMREHHERAKAKADTPREAIEIYGPDDVVPMRAEDARVVGDGEV